MLSICLASCGGAPSQDNTSGSGGSTAPGPPGATPIPGSDFNVDALRDIYKNVSDSSPTVVSRLRSDWLTGVLTQTEYLKQKICYLYDQTCLQEKYKPTQTTRAPHCGASEFQTFEEEMAALGNEEVIAFWKAKLPPDETQSDDTTRKVFPQSTTATAVAKLITARKITTANGKYCFWVRRSDPFINQLQFVSDRLDFESEGKKFQIFYQSGKKTHVTAANQIITAFKNSSIVSTFKKITGAAPKAFDVDDPTCNPDQAYRLFLVDGPTVGTSEAAHITWELVGSGRTYIDFRVEHLGTCWVTQFVRDTRTCATQGQNQANGVVAHEYFHASESAALSVPKALYSIDPCADCLANWAVDRMFPTSDLETSHLTGHLYYPHVPLGFDEPLLKRYGASLFFSFLHDLGGDDVITRYISKLSNSGFVKALEESAESLLIHDSFKDAFHEFAEASLNLAGVQGVHSFRQKHSDYQDFFLSGVGALPPLPDFRSTVAVRKMVIDITNLPTRSIRYFGLTSSAETFNALNHSLSITANDWIKKEGGLSAIAIKIDEKDPFKYTVLKRVNLKKSGAETVCFSDLNKEPEVLILVASNGTRTPLSGKIEIESQPFCNPVNFFAKWSRPEKGTEYTGTDEVTVQATLKYNPGPMVADKPLSAGPFATMTQHLTQTSSTMNLTDILRTSSRLHASSVTITPTINKSQTSEGCTTTYTYDGGPLVVGANDFVGMSIVMLPTTPGSGKSSYSFVTSFENPKFLNATVRKICSGTCGENCSGTEEVTLTLPNVKGTYSSGAKVLNEADRSSNDATSSTWAIEFTEPLEVQEVPAAPKPWYWYDGDDLKRGLVIKPFLFDVR